MGPIMWHSGICAQKYVFSKKIETVSKATCFFQDSNYFELCMVYFVLKKITIHNFMCACVCSSRNKNYVRYNFSPGRQKSISVCRIEFLEIFHNRLHSFELTNIN